MNLLKISNIFFLTCHRQALSDGERLVTVYWLNDVITLRILRVPWLAIHLPTHFSWKEKPLTNHVSSNQQYFKPYPINEVSATQTRKKRVMISSENSPKKKGQKKLALKSCHKKIFLDYAPEFFKPTVRMRGKSK